MADLTLYFDAKHAINVHDWIIEKTGGLPGMRDRGPLESVLEHIQNEDYYPTVDAKLAHLVFGINKFHAFHDGNKRSSLTLGAYFLTLNGYDYCVPQFIVQMENIVVAVAEGKIDKPLLQKIIVSLIEEDDFSDELKLELLCAFAGDARGEPGGA